MAAKSLWRHEPRGKLAGVQRYPHLGIELTQEPDNAHVLGIVGHRDYVVFAAHEIDGEDARVGRGELQPEQSLSKHEFLRRVAEDL